MTANDSQLAIPDAPTGLSEPEYVARLIDLSCRCKDMDPDQYQKELQKLTRLRIAGLKQEVNHENLENQNSQPARNHRA